MKPDQRLLAQLTLLLMAFATVGLETGLLTSNQPSIMAWGNAGVILLVVLGLEWAARRQEARLGRAPRLVTSLLVTLFVMPFLMEIIRRKLWNTGYAVEMLLLLGLRNAGWGLAVMSFRTTYLRLSALSSLSLMIFAFVLVNQPVMSLIATLYLLVACLWLICMSMAQNRHGEVVRRFPLVPILLALIMIGGTFGIALLSIRGLGGTLAGWMPGSGGNGASDPFGLGGVNDGEGEVGAKQKADGVGFVDSNVYMESPNRSLYDAVDEMYGEVRPIGKVIKAISIKERVSGELSAKMRGAKSAGKEFSLQRRTPPARHTSPSPEADALLYLTGRTPISLKMITYDRFNGMEWHEITGKNTVAPSIFLEQEGNDHWLRLNGTSPSVFGPSESHTVKFGLIETSHIPSTPNLMRMRVGMIDRLDFYNGSTRDTLKMDVARIPAGTAIQLESAIVDARQLDRHPEAWRAPGKQSRFARIPAVVEEDADLQRLAHEWTDGKPFGWPQVQAIIQRLRTEYQIDRTAVVPADCTSPVHHFLFTSKRGPDYLFATTTTVMLRLLGYQARPVSGFYASPQRYNERSGHTLIGTENVHFWAEVQYYEAGFEPVWVPIEPSPGYETLQPRATLLDRLLAFVASVSIWMRKHMLICIGGISIIGTLWRFRRELSDQFALLRWRYSLSRVPQTATIATLRLLEHRFTLAGGARPPGITPTKWYPMRLRDRFDEEVIRDLSTLLNIVTWLTFSAGTGRNRERGNSDAGGTVGASRWSQQQTQALCCRIVQALSLRRLTEKKTIRRKSRRGKE